MPALEADFQRQSYAFTLPEELIAQEPAPIRSASRLMVLPLHEEGVSTLDVFENIASYLPKDCLLVANNSRVVPARFFGQRVSGGKVELLLLTPPPLFQPIPSAESGWQKASAEVLLRSSKKVAVGETVFFGDAIKVHVTRRGEFGKCLVDFCWQGDLQKTLEKAGVLPLPPYIKRLHKNTEERLLDQERYQTSYARKDKAGSVAAPTAGLHFTPELKDAIQKSGRTWAEVTLYVGYGTFSPVRNDDIREHPMHPEYVELSEETAGAIRKAKQDGRPVIAVGTTSARVLEGVFRSQRQPAALGVCFNAQAQFNIKAYKDWINIFLYPSQPFYVIDGLITNFHLPESSLLMLVSALAGRKRVLGAYEQAVKEKFRFFSYGDAMLLC